MGIYLRKGENCTWMAGHDPQAPGQTCRYPIEPPFLAPADGWYDVAYDTKTLTAALTPRATTSRSSA